MRIHNRIFAFWTVLMAVFVVFSSFGMKTRALTNAFLPDAEVTVKTDAPVSVIVDPFEAYGVLVEAFGMETMEPQYPDSYAGAYVITDQRTLVILVTNPEDFQSGDYYKALEGSPAVRLETVEHSYNELAGLKWIADELINNGVGVTSYYVDQIKNSFCVGVNGEELKTLQNAGKLNAYAQYPVIFESEGYAVAAADLPGTATTGTSSEAIPAASNRTLLIAGIAAAVAAAVGLAAFVLKKRRNLPNV